MRDVSVGPWEIETNPNANGGLHNAVMSVAHEMSAGKVRPYSYAQCAPGSHSILYSFGWAF